MWCHIISYNFCLCVKNYKNIFILTLFNGRTLHKCINFTVRYPFMKTKKYGNEYPYRSILLSSVSAGHSNSCSCVIIGWHSTYICIRSNARMALFCGRWTVSYLIVYNRVKYVYLPTFFCSLLSWPYIWWIHSPPLYVIVSLPSIFPKTLT